LGDCSFDRSATAPAVTASAPPVIVTASAREMPMVFVFMGQPLPFIVRGDLRQRW
jgi:hypothetical protein